MNTIAIGFGLCAALLATSSPAQDTASQTDKVHQAFENARQKQREKPSALRKTVETAAEILIDPIPSTNKFDRYPSIHSSPTPNPALDAQNTVSRPELR